MLANTAEVPDIGAVTSHGSGGAMAGAAEDMAILMLDEGGVICDCNRASETLFNYPRNELVWRHVSMLLPQLAEFDLMPDGQPNPRLRFLSRTGRHYRAETKGGGHFASNLFFNRLESTGHCRMSLIVRPAALPSEMAYA